jgi:hypothetical protein
MRVKMNITLRERTISPVRLILEDSLICSFLLFVDVFFALGDYILFDRIYVNFSNRLKYHSGLKPKKEVGTRFLLGRRRVELAPPGPTSITPCL